jgi:riboflavin kinase / FMN adenylyltransferase
MTVHYQLEQLPYFRNAIVTIGTFDGVHTGHRKILQQLKDEAAKHQGETVIITFNPHPRRVVRGQAYAVQLLNTMQEKIQLLSEQGIDHLVIVPFTEAFASQPAKDYVEHFLVRYFHPHTIIIGYDHHFGYQRQGNFHLLESLKSTFHYRVREIPEHVLQQSIISSTKIREALLAGRVAEANTFLGYTYFFEGLVVEGNKLGRTIGYPTANLQLQDTEKLVPGNGVYAVDAIVQGEKNEQFANQRLKGMMNIGIRPTINGTQRTIEVNLFDFSADIYGSLLQVYVKAKLRDERKFAGLDELKAQLAKDKEAAFLIPAKEGLIDGGERSEIMS